MKALYSGDDIVEFYADSEDRIKEIASYSHLTVDELCKKINSIVLQSLEENNEKRIEPKNSIQRGNVVYDLDNPNDVATLEHLSSIEQRKSELEYENRRKYYIRKKKILTICLIIGCICVAAIITIIGCLN